MNLAHQNIGQHLPLIIVHAGSELEIGHWTKRAINPH